MRLKRLTVRGFKSFADRTEFDFDSPLTGVIGPNGCGKSNVVDALKWVLGDQRARSLRGKEMTDLIFNGAEGRDAAQQAEVQIQLAAEPGEAIGGMTELDIGRRLTREKESHYLINGEAVRLKDVRDVLMDTGLGVGAYMVMEQGRIDAVLSANPEERRAIFEEAAGISRFKLQKRETLRKLDRTEQNLTRVQDLLEERQRRIRSLKAQAGRARRWLELREELRDLRTAVAVVEGANLRREQGELSGRLEEHTQQLQQLTEQESGFSDRQQTAEEQIEQLATAQQEAQELLRELRSKAQSLREQSEALQLRGTELDADAKDAETQRTELTQQHQDKLQALEAARQRIVTLEADLAKLGDEIEQRRQQLAEQQNAVRDLQRQRESQRERLLEQIHRRTKARNAAHEQEAQIRAAAGRLNGLQSSFEQLDVEATQVEMEIYRLDTEMRQRDKVLQALKAEEEICLRELGEADQDAAQLAAAESELREKLSAVLGRLQVLQDMEAQMEGLDKGPRFLLEAQPEGLRGRLSDLLQVDLKHSAALEAALGPYVQALVVDTREHADAMLQLLREKGQGRAVLLVLSELQAVTTIWQPPGGLTALVDQISCPDWLSPLVQWLLRGVVLVDDLQQAAGTVTHSGVCYVSSDGSLRRGPRLEGGAAHQTGLIVRKARIQVMEKEADELRSERDRLADGRQQVAARVAALRDEADELGGFTQAEREALQAQAGRRERRLERAVELERELRAMQLELQELRSQRLASLARLGDCLLQDVLCRKREEHLTQVEATLNQDLGEAQQRQQQANAEQQELRVRQAAARTDREGTRDAIRMHEQSVRELRELDRQLASRAGEAQQAAETARKQSAERAEQAGEVEQKQQEQAKVVEELQGRNSAARGELDQLRNEATEVQTNIAQLKESVNNDRMREAELGHRFGRLEERLHEDFSVSLRRCLGEVVGFGIVAEQEFGPALPSNGERPMELSGPPLPPASLQAQLSLRRLWESEEFVPTDARKQAQVVQSRLDRLGAVNLDAVQELEEEETGLVQTERDVEDLLASRKSLVEALQRMEEESRTLFERTFEEARGNFQDLFRKLFQGGKADMFLAQGEDSLEGGIEIMARPPGKQLQSINLLSGGERSMTALAILFAVFKVKPAPFCILDEVDAALDDTNVERFLRVLREFVGPTQFCVVTHHKRTMAECQMLYGITMQKRGVSSPLAVSLDEVDELTPQGLAGRGEDRVRDTGRKTADPALKSRVAGEEAIGFS